MIDKKLLKHLKEQKALIDFIKLKKSNCPPHVKVAEINRSVKLKEAYKHRFFDFLKERKCYEYFFNAIEEQRHGVLEASNVYRIVDISIWWEGTAEGHAFWKRENQEWMNFIEKTLKKN